jgi:hypothetical protein
MVLISSSGGASESAPHASEARPASSQTTAEVVGSRIVVGGGMSRAGRVRRWLSCRCRSGAQWRSARGGLPLSVSLSDGVLSARARGWCMRRGAMAMGVYACVSWHLDVWSCWRGARPHQPHLVGGLWRTRTGNSLGCCVVISGARLSARTSHTSKKNRDNNLRAAPG